MAFGGAYSMRGAGAATATECQDVHLEHGGIPVEHRCAFKVMRVPVESTIRFGGKADSMSPRPPIVGVPWGWFPDRRLILCRD